MLSAFGFENNAFWILKFIYIIFVLGKKSSILSKPIQTFISKFFGEEKGQVHF